MAIRPAGELDKPAILPIIAPVLSAGETYAVETDLTEAEMLGYWFMPAHEVFVFEAEGEVLGTYYLMANQGGNGAHVSNCGYMVSATAQGRGVAAAMCEHSQTRARERGFRAMQFNHVVSTNTRAVALWQKLGFDIVGTLPKAFRHPLHGFVDSYVMFKSLT
ncbi:Ribosomal protein S18 acetylase RimI [Devosia crocina]|uniref:Ribosomal protein S18 acetylase RimI n=1 Tax=Devosia crocina TaxID=429728 RepID=A0A1I7N8M2_9HYPH|nr:GNAT family N-acetyltransferase [Devosia crocina]SFV31020.1 Ribosomal protein S18 acetylase RimI [Devosia crocina]